MSRAAERELKVVSFPAEAVPSESSGRNRAHEARLWRRRFNARRSLNQLGLEPAAAAVVQEFERVCDARADYFERRLGKVETALRRALKSETLQAEHRAAIVGLVAPGRDANLLGAAEGELVAAYRTATPKRRGAILELARVFREASERGPE